MKTKWVLTSRGRRGVITRRGRGRRRIPVGRIPTITALVVVVLGVSAAPPASERSRGEGGCEGDEGEVGAWFEEHVRNVRGDWGCVKCVCGVEARRGEKEVWGRIGVGVLRRWVVLGWIETMAGRRALGFYNTQADEKVKMLASSKGRVESRARLTVDEELKAKTMKRLARLRWRVSG